MNLQRGRNTAGAPEPSAAGVACVCKGQKHAAEPPAQLARAMGLRPAQKPALALGRWLEPPAGMQQPLAPYKA
jgi:hypothetical protein